jgi:hypothetical protein
MKPGDPGFRRLSLPDREFVHPAVTCEDCGETCLYAKDEGGHVVKLVPKPRPGVILAHLDGEQYAYKALVYDPHFCTAPRRREA